MAEHATQAVSGSGTQVLYGGLLITDAYVNFHEVIAFDPPDVQADEIDTTHFESPEGYKEFIPGKKDAGSATVTFNWRPDLYADQANMRTDQAAGTLRYYKFILPTAIEQRVFRAFVKGMKPGISPTGALTMAVTLRVSRETAA